MLPIITGFLSSRTLKGRGRTGGVLTSRSKLGGEIPGGPVLGFSALLSRATGQLLVGNPRSYKPCGLPKEKKGNWAEIQGKLCIWGGRVYGKFLHGPLNFALNPKLLIKCQWNKHTHAQTNRSSFQPDSPCPLMTRTCLPGRIRRGGERSKFPHPSCAAFSCPECLGNQTLWPWQEFTRSHLFSFSGWHGTPSDGS